MTALHIRWKGRRWLLFGTLKDGGPIATREQYRNGILSEAHLYPDGVIKNFGTIIGHRDDLVVLGPARVPKPAPDALLNLLKACGL